LNESSSLLGSRVTAKPRLVHQHAPSPGASKPVTFASLGISPSILSALSKMAIHAPTEIQQACIPPLLAGLLLGSGLLDCR
jgi:ATP-dependent RNA helicase DDX49/DBP8